MRLSLDVEAISKNCRLNCRPMFEPVNFVQEIEIIKTRILNKPACWKISQENGEMKIPHINGGDSLTFKTTNIIANAPCYNTDILKRFNDFSHINARSSTCCIVFT